MTPAEATPQPASPQPGGEIRDDPGRRLPRVAAEHDSPGALSVQAAAELAAEEAHRRRIQGEFVRPAAQSVRAEKLHRIPESVMETPIFACFGASA